MTTIRTFRARLVRVPLTRPWGADVTSVGVIATHVTRSDGAEGWGFSWTPQIGAEAVLALLAHDITSFAIGREARPGPSVSRTAATRSMSSARSGLPTLTLTA